MRTETYKIVTCSEKAKAMIETTEGEPVKYNAASYLLYPLDSMKIGDAFAVPFDHVREDSLRTVMSRKGKKKRKKFVVLKHDDMKVFEVARVA